MTQKKKKTPAEGLPPTSDYRYGAKRKNLPPAKIAGEGEVPKTKKVKYAYSPHLDPVLRFDPMARADKVAGIVEKACRGVPLQPPEQEILRAVGVNWEQPWLEWAGKQEEQAHGRFAVDPVVLHIHERVSAQAVLRNAVRRDIDVSLFAAPEQSYSEALQFYQHDVDWANRLILGDSLQVMSSLAQRENLAGKVQMTYIDPPYGIRFRSNFQPELASRDVKDGSDDDLTREPEMIRAYRDTWHLGRHSYLQYLRTRLHLVRTLLADSGSVFVQINDAGLGTMRALLDEVFGASSYCATISYVVSSGMGANLLPRQTDYLLWYARDRLEGVRYRQLLRTKALDGEGASAYRLAQYPNGETRSLSQGEIREPTRLDPTVRVFRHGDLTKPGPGSRYEVSAFGRTYTPGKRWWGLPEAAMRRGLLAERVSKAGSTLAIRRYLDDFPAFPVTNVWTDTATGAALDKQYVVQTNPMVVERCMLMTTEPGDLVLDPTCGSGTTALVAEQWGRRWITIDTSRVALSIARQRVLTARFEHFRTVGGPRGALGIENPASGFRYRTVPHVTLGAIANSTDLDPIFAKHESILAAKLNAANSALAAVHDTLRGLLRAKLAAKQEAEGKRAITDADRRRWILPPDNRDSQEKWIVDPGFTGWYEWEVPFDSDPVWPKRLQEAVDAYRSAWRAKMDEVNACIRANADQEELVDQPEVVRGVVRVSGPFTVEGVQPEEVSLTPEGLRDVTPSEDTALDVVGDEQNAEAYLEGMVAAIRRDGVLFPGNRRRGFGRVERLHGAGVFDGLHAEATWEGDEDLKVAIAFGPQYGPVTAAHLESLIRASRRYHHLVVAAFSFAPEASAIIEESKHPKLQIHMAHIRPDMNPAMKGLLKETPNSQLFTVFGMPAVDVRRNKAGEWVVELEGVDIYDPVENVVRSTKSEKVAAWFLDSDFDGRCFCVCQAFFPNQDAWEKIARALGSEADPGAFEAFKGTVSLPFAGGKHRQIAVKVIDPRGNEVMTLRRLKG